MLSCEASQTLFAQLLQPVIVRDRFSQLLARAINSCVETAPPIAPQWTERQFDWGDRTRPNCQDINDIEQDPARWPKALRDVVAKIFYTRLRGAFVFHGMSSITLDTRLVGEA